MLGEKRKSPLIFRPAGLLYHTFRASFPYLESRGYAEVLAVKVAA